MTLAGAMVFMKGKVCHGCLCTGLEYRYIAQKQNLKIGQKDECSLGRMIFIACPTERC